MNAVSLMQPALTDKTNTLRIAFGPQRGVFDCISAIFRFDMFRILPEEG